MIGLTLHWPIPASMFPHISTLNHTSLPPRSGLQGADSVVINMAAAGVEDPVADSQVWVCVKVLGHQRVLAL